MSLIHAACPSCHRHVDLHPDEIRLDISPGRDDGVHCRFTYPRCKTPTDHIPDDHEIALLVSGGVVAHATPGALTEDDLTTLKQAMLITDDLADVAAEELR